MLSQTARASKFKRHYLGKDVDNALHVILTITSYQYQYHSSSWECTDVKVCGRCSENTFTEERIKDIFKDNENCKIIGATYNIESYIKQSSCPLVAGSIRLSFPPEAEKTAERS